MDCMSVLKVANLTKTFTVGVWPFQQTQITTVVDSIAFDLQKGEILGLLGANGAGKTTTIQMLLGNLTPTSGVINYFGLDFEQARIQVLKRIGSASGYDKLPARLTVLENLDLIGRIYGLPSIERSIRINQLLRSFGMLELRDRQTGTLSAGQATRVMLAKAFLANPEIVLLDEPTASLDPDIAYDVRKFILQQSKERAVSVLITSHNMNEVTEVCDRVLVLQSGKIVANNTPELLAKSVAKVRIHLTITKGLDVIISYLQGANLIYTIQGAYLTVEVDEHAIAQFLIDLGVHKVTYSQISIDKPTLEDYFLSISKSNNRGAV